MIIRTIEDEWHPFLRDILGFQFSISSSYYKIEHIIENFINFEVMWYHRRCGINYISLLYARVRGTHTY